VDERDFHRMILDEPDDDGLRLVFAAWLEETGRPPQPVHRLPRLRHMILL
jgi:uncharacterized protein (TIGR02996 family)